MTMTTVLLLLVTSILTTKQIHCAVHLLNFKSRQAPQAITPVIDTNAFNQCFKNNARHHRGSPCYPAVYDFEECFTVNQTMMAAETPDSIYECACLPWPTDNRTLLNDMNLCSTCLVDHGQPADAIGLKADTSAWDKFCSSNTASNVTTDAILALLQEAPFFPALNQLEASATSAYRYLTTGIVGTLTMAAASVTVTPATIAMSGWETMVMEPPPTTSSTTEYTASSTVADTMGTEFTETLLIVTTISEYPLPSGTSANSPTTPRISASATATGGAVTLVCIGRMGSLALVMSGVLTAIIPVM